MADPSKKRYRYIWYVTFERTMMILACIVGINCAIGLYHSAVNGELTARVSSTLVQSPAYAIEGVLAIIYWGWTIGVLWVEYFTQNIATTEISIQSFDYQEYAWDVIKNYLSSFLFHKERDSLRQFSMNVIVEDKREIDFFYMDESVLEDVREITKKRRRQDKYKEYPHFFEISNLVHYKYRFEITYLKHSHLVIQMRPLPKEQKRDLTYLPDDYVSLPDRVKNLYRKVKGRLKKK